MTNQQEAVMWQALLALQRADKISGSANNKKAIAALQQVLEQPADHIPDAGEMVDEPVHLKWTTDYDGVYDRSFYITPFGAIIINWKGWKSEPHHAWVDRFPWEFNATGTPEEVRKACEAEYFRRIRSHEQPADHVPDAKKMIQPVAWWNPKKDTVSTDPVHRNNPDCVPLVPLENRGNE